MQMVMTDDAQTEAPPKNEKRCPCGHARGHLKVSAEGVYTFSGYLRLFFGISARPTKVRYRCRRCDKVFDSTVDPAILDQYY